MLSKIQGSNFGPENGVPTVTVGEGECDSCVIIVSDSRIYCTNCPASNGAIIVSIYGRSSGPFTYLGMSTKYL